MALCQTFDVGYMTSFLFKNASYTNKKLASSPKHTIPRMKIVEDLIRESQKANGEIPFPWGPVSEMARRGLEASVKEERQAGAKLVVSVYKSNGFAKIEGLVQGLSKGGLEMIHKQIPEAESYLKLKNQRV